MNLFSISLFNSISGTIISILLLLFLVLIGAEYDKAGKTKIASLFGSLILCYLIFGIYSVGNCIGKMFEILNP
jgi:hypothetical protein